MQNGLHRTPPSLKELEAFAENIFSQVDVDKSKSISFKEFSDWMCNSWDLQDFMLMYAMIQTWENAERRTRNHQVVYLKIFNEVAGDRKIEIANPIK